MRALYFCLCLFLVGLTPLYSQIKNGSFENTDGSPSLEGWTSICSSGISSAEETPPNGGMWSASIPAGNTQGCLSAFVYQVISGAATGEIWEVEATVRVDSTITSILPHTIGIGLAVYHSNRFNIHAWNETTVSTTSTNWIRLTYRDTTTFSPKDSLVVVLNPGLTSGPLFASANFDNVVVRKIGRVSSVEDKAQEMRPLQVSPNPLRTSTTIDLQNHEQKAYTLSLYNCHGEVVRNLGIVKSKHYTLERGDLPQGLYFLQVQENNSLVTSVTILVQ